MIQSMTGYCSSIISTGKINHTIELKCLNSKYLDLNLKLPYILRKKEFELKIKILIKSISNYGYLLRDPDTFYYFLKNTNKDYISAEDLAHAIMKELKL